MKKLLIIFFMIPVFGFSQTTEEFDFIALNRLNRVCISLCVPIRTRTKERMHSIFGLLALFFFTSGYQSGDRLKER